jgi:hypothetical protein
MEDLELLTHQMGMTDERTWLWGGMDREGLMNGSWDCWPLKWEQLMKEHTLRGYGKKRADERYELLSADP